MTCVALLSLVGVLPSRLSAEPPPWKVPAHLEIEVIDPGVDALGNPAVILQPRGPQMTVEIPPTVLVHRYYYTGDRTFQGPYVPGGPSILVVNHPTTGERCYVPAQMLPGAPRVKYSACGIEYDYGEQGITLLFHKECPPAINYRSGKSWTQRARDLTHAEDVKKRAQDAVDYSKGLARRGKNVSYGALAEVYDTSNQYVLTPVRNTLGILPFGRMLTDNGIEQRLTERAEQHRQDSARRKAEEERKRNEWSLRTNR